MVKIYQIIDANTNEVIYVGQTVQTLQHRFSSHLKYNKELIEYIQKTNHKIKIELIKNVDDKEKFVEETRYTIEAYKKNKKILNLRFGQFTKEKIDKYLKLSTDEILNKIYKIETKSLRKVNKNKKSFIFVVFNYPIKNYLVNNIDNLSNHQLQNLFLFIAHVLPKDINAYVGICTCDGKVFDSSNSKKIYNEKLFKSDTILKVYYDTWDKVRDRAFVFGLILYKMGYNYVNTMMGKYHIKYIQQMIDILKYPSLKNLIKDIYFEKDKKYRIAITENVITKEKYIFKTKNSIVKSTIRFLDNTDNMNIRKRYELFKTYEICICKNEKDVIQRHCFIVQNYLNQGEKLYNKRIGNKLTKEQNEQLNKYRHVSHEAWNKGKSWSEEHKRKLSIAHKNQKPTEKCIQRSIECHKGKKQSLETIQKRIQSLHKKVKCIPLNMIFDSAREAGQKFGLKTKTIQQAIKRGTYCGEYNNIKLKWEYVK